MWLASKALRHFNIPSPWSLLTFNPGEKHRDELLERGREIGRRIADRYGNPKEVGIGAVLEQVKKQTPHLSEGDAREGQRITPDHPSPVRRHVSVSDRVNGHPGGAQPGQREQPEPQLCHGPRKRPRRQVQPRDAGKGHGQGKEN